MRIVSLKLFVSHLHQPPRYYYHINHQTTLPPNHATTLPHYHTTTLPHHHTTTLSHYTTHHHTTTPPHHKTHQSCLNPLQDFHSSTWWPIFRPSSIGTSHCCRSTIPWRPTHSRCRCSPELGWLVSCMVVNSWLALG